MSMISFPFTAKWLGHVQEFADTPWCCDAFDALFVGHGWATPSENGEPAVGWTDHWPLGDPADEVWHVVLGEYPRCADTRDRSVVCDDPKCHDDSFLVLPLAYSAIGVRDAGTGLPPSPEELWGTKLPSQAVLHPDAREEDFTALYDDAARLLRTRLGDPLPRPRPPHDPDRHVSWEHGKSLVTLFRGENLYNYSLDDWIGIDIRPVS
ncbi:hypothetical protein AB0D04_32780 [Streptomyces sp. NPDC048483]|uniref:hypothetical protein n=1 Tax=Streptomyces sp. NPDC048483 TaxID=3154927 RepID=UPI00343DC158